MRDIPAWPFVILMLFLCAWLVRRVIQHETRVKEGKPIDPAMRKGFYVDVDAVAKHRFAPLVFESLLLVAVIGYAPHLCQSTYDRFHALEAGFGTGSREIVFLVYAYRLFGANGPVVVTGLGLLLVMMILIKEIRRRIQILRSGKTSSPPPLDRDR